VVRDYGHLASSVQFLRAPDIAVVPHNTDGWLSQQILKLIVSQHISTDRYVVLDAKNHLVFPLQRTFLEAGDRIRSPLTNYTMHSMRRLLERTLRYFGMNPDEYVKAFFPTVTPFTFPTALVRDLVRVVAEREKMPFANAFLNIGCSEFFLFASFISLNGTTEDLYDFSGVSCPIIREDHAIRGVRNLRHHIARGEKNALPFFAVHRRALPWLDDRSRQAISEFWQRRGLFRTPEDGVDFLASKRSVKGKGTNRLYRRWRSRLLGAAARIIKIIDRMF